MSFIRYLFISLFRYSSRPFYISLFIYFVRCLCMYCFRYVVLMHVLRLVTFVIYLFIDVCFDCFL